MDPHLLSRSLLPDCCGTPIWLTSNIKPITTTEPDSHTTQRELLFLKTVRRSGFLWTPKLSSLRKGEQEKLFSLSPLRLTVAVKTTLPHPNLGSPQPSAVNLPCNQSRAKSCPLCESLAGECLFSWGFYWGASRPVSNPGLICFLQSHHSAHLLMFTSPPNGK